jgi:hypothetical protein
VDAPQHIRTWDDGKIFFNYVPIQETGLTIEPGTKFVMKYRVIAMDGKADADKMKAFFEDYTTD